VFLFWFFRSTAMVRALLARTIALEGMGSEMMRGATAPQHDFAAGVWGGDLMGDVKMQRRCAMQRRSVPIQLGLFTCGEISGSE